MANRPNKPTKYRQGYYSCVNESKYIANTSDIVYRSSLELKFCLYADNSPNVLKWGSEVVKIPYISPLDGKQHNYIMDFYVEMKNPNHPAGLERLLIEVKPHEEAKRVINNTPPEKPKKITPKSLESWEYALKEYWKNKHKWSFAQEWARQKGMKFIIVTEEILNKFN